MTELTHARLLQLLHYDPETGNFTRRVATGYRGCHRVGSLCGSLDKTTGYVRVGLDGKEYWAHRLAWFYVHGEWAPHDVDHRDRVRHHNWIANLRAATRAENLHNQVKANVRSKSGVRGVVWDPRRQTWKASISVGNRTRHLGRFATIEAAEAVYMAAKLQHIGEVSH